TLVSQTASLTNNLAGRQQVVDQVLDNLSALIGTVNAHDQTLGTLVDDLDRLVGGLAGERAQIASTIDGVSTLATGVSNVLTQSQPALNHDIQSLASASGSLAANQHNIDAVIQGFPGFVNALTKVASSGNYLSVYVCNLTIYTQNSLDVSLSSILPAPQFPAPLSVPSGAIGDQSQHTASCR
ncbi:MAG: MCE family protein, partial [Acidimicrobiales bacterium]